MGRRCVNGGKTPKSSLLMTWLLASRRIFVSPPISHSLVVTGGLCAAQHLTEKNTTNLSLCGHMNEIMIRHITVPVVESCTTDSHPHERAYNVHDGVGQLTLVGGRTEQVGDQLDTCVDEIADKHSRRHDFGVRTFLFVHVPCAANAQEVAAIACPVENQHDNVEYLNAYPIISQFW